MVRYPSLMNSCYFLLSYVIFSQGKFEGSERPRSARLSDTKPRKSDAREPIRRGPIGSKPRESYDNEEERDRPKSGYKDRYMMINIKLRF